MSLLDDLALSLDYAYGPTERLKQAIIPKSVNKEHNNDVLELRGDAILSVIVTERLVQLNPNSNSGWLTETRKKYISTPNLTLVGTKLKLDRLIEPAPGQKELGTKVIADAVEAVVAAIYEDQGMKAAEKFVLRSIMDVINKGGPEFEANKEKLHAKSVLQEYSHKTFGCPPHYETDPNTESGDLKYQVEVTLRNGVFARGVGPSVKQAEIKAASALAKKLGLPL